MIFEKGYDLVPTLAHELGHAIGLAHDSNDKFSVMYPRTGGVIPRLAPNDRLAIRKKYNKIP